jgi:clan AA aspartic protease
MITGVIKREEARIRLKVKGRAGREQEVEAVIDTGYSGALTLPPVMIALLGLSWRSVERATLADGSVCVFQVYDGKLVWDGKVRKILVDEAGADPLIGMRLLRGHELKLQVRARGKVTIKRLPPR